MKAVVVAALLVAAAPAQAQPTVVHDSERFRSPQCWAIELRFGPYSPEIDSQFKGAENPPHESYFGSKRRVMAQLELDYQFFQMFGSAAIGAQVGYFRETAKAFDVTGTKRSADTTALLLVPTSLQLIYRMDVPARRLGIPLVPYAKAGLSYTMWRVTDANGETAKGTDGKKGKGGTPGWQAAAGVALLLDFLDPGSARALDSDTGVNHTYLFVEFDRFEASGLGKKNALHVGDTTWLAGLMFEF
jgi:hypothetical protein